MKRSESIVKITEALLSAQKAIPSAVKDAKNPFFKSKYADLNSILEACKKHLHDNGIVLLQPHFTNELGTFVETLLIHSSGEFVSSETLVLAKTPEPQALGSAISYARRYGLQSMLSMSAEDDDAELAQGRKF